MTTGRVGESTPPTFEKLRRCSRCGETKPLTNFVRNRRERSGYGYHCRPCHNRVSRENRERNHGSSRNYLLKYRYGASADDIDNLLRHQNGLCAICLKRKGRHVDHDHVSGAVRGILCFRCNGALGQFGDDVRRMEKAVAYLLQANGVTENSIDYGQVFTPRTKTCPDCGLTKYLEEFPRNKSSADCRGAYCKPCHNARGRETRQRLYGGSRHYHLKRKYGLGAAEVDDLIATQGGLCAVCRERPAEHVDHDHRTGTVRGILCLGCNTGLGQFGDDADVVLRAIDYLNRWARPDTVQEPAVPYILSVA